jgi:hypothetical protein
MSITDANDYSNDKIKLQNFLSEIKFTRNFKKKLYELYLNEFDEKFDHILIKKDSEFMNTFLKRVRTILEDMYSNDCFENEELAILMKTYEIEIYENYYKPQFNLLSTAFNLFESARNSETPEIGDFDEIDFKSNFFYNEDNMTIQDVNLKEERESNKILKEIISSDMCFRKHCRFIDDVPRHFCKNGNLTNFIKLRTIKKDYNITHIICTDCKLSYKSSCVLLYCNFCSLNFYSSISDFPLETTYLQPATWEKYHCSIVVNDQMRCIQCKEILYLDLKENLLKCVNEKCKFESDPYSIYWTCVSCKSEFQTNAKIYNPLEYKIVRSAIKEALILKKEARPDFLPCCNDHVVNDEMIFLHKKECSGRIFFGTMNNRRIIVCEKCRSLSNYEKFIWTCPLCDKRFKRKNIEKTSGVDSCINNLRIKKENNMASTSSTINLIESEGNMTPYSENTKDKGIDSRSISYKGSLNPNSYKNNSNTIESNSILSKNSSDNDKFFGKSNTNTFNNKEKLENELKNSSYSNSEYADDSLKISIGSSHNTRSIKLIKDDCDNEENEYFYNNDKNFKKQKYNMIGKCSILNTVKDIEPKSSAIRNIRSFKTSKALNYADAQIESNPVKRFNNKYRNDEKIKVTFLEVEPSKIIFNPLGTKEENSNTRLTKSKSPRFYLSRIYNKSNSTGNESSMCLLKNSSNNSMEDNQSNSYQKLISSIKNLGFNEFDMDEYVIDTLIGEGAYAKIYKVHDDKSNFFALKKNITHDINELEALIKQYIIIKKLKHSFLLDLKGISIQKLDSTTTSIYVLMDIAKNDWGNEIKARSMESPKSFYTEEELIRILKQLTLALAYMQRMNVVHRDIKPHNVLIFDNFTHKISDFGETQFLKENPFEDNTIESNEKKGIRGTELFMSPVLYQGLKNFKNENDIIHNPYKSDCFSVGLCILQAASLSLDVLYNIRKIGNNLENQNINNSNEKCNDRLEKILSEAISNYSEDFKNLIYAMLNFNENERPDFVELERMLRNF